jgi:hypothetical protein
LPLAARPVPLPIPPVRQRKRKEPSCPQLENLSAS